jgi:predicted phosphodiesterase
MYKYTHFIPENIASVGAKKIGVYDANGRRVGVFGLGKLAPPNATKLYSFCAISDVHIGKTADVNSASPPTDDFRRALAYTENSDCAFTCICGDLTENGTTAQLTQYRWIVNEFSKNVYAIVGNHENYSHHIKNTANYDIANYTGQPLYYKFEYGNDVYLMCGCYAWYEGDTELKGNVFTKDYLQWIYETLEANRNKRCFVFCHVFPFNDGVGNIRNANGTFAYTLDIWTSTYGTVFENLMKHYKNTVLFHGHSHIRFKAQEFDKKANYSSEVGYRSIHIPSLSAPRDKSGNELENIYAESEGYIVDVFENCIILNGRDFIDNDANGHGIGIATYKIDTTLQTIAANTFTDSTGTITT